jgi:hypothetical protein
MDNDLDELEAELKRLRPAAPSADLAARVERALDAPRWNLMAWAALPLAAALVGVVFLKEKTAVTSVVPAPEPAKVAAAFKPVSADNVLYDHRDEGLVTLTDGTTARRSRSSYVDTITWKHPGTQASLRWSMPRTVERVVPVSFQ